MKALINITYDVLRDTCNLDNFSSKDESYVNMLQDKFKPKTVEILHIDK